MPKPGQELPTRFTPIIWANTVCSFAIVMLDYFFPGDLPGADPGLIYPPWDVTTYQDIYQASQLLSFGCVESHMHAGWRAVGRSSFLTPGIIGGKRKKVLRPERGGVSERIESSYARDANDLR